MHSARTTDEDETEPRDPEPAVLSYMQFRNHLGLLEWRRRRAQYGQARSGDLGSCGMQQRGGEPLALAADSDAVDRL